MYSSAEFLDIGRWVTAMKIDPHLVDVLYELVDEEGNGKLTIKTSNPIWRNELSLQKNELIKKINNTGSEIKLTEIIFR